MTDVRPLPRVRFSMNPDIPGSGELLATDFTMVPLFVGIGRLAGLGVTHRTGGYIRIG